MKWQSGCLLALCLSPSVAIAATPAKVEKAAHLVREALHREVLGLENERQALLVEASELDPEDPASQWAQGQVRYQKQWVDINDVPSLLSKNRAFSRYLVKRVDFADTPDGQLALADWCKANGLRDQERAHLCRVVDLAPQHAVARGRLGFVKVGDEWLDVAEYETSQRKAAEEFADFQRWQPVIDEILKDLQANTRQRRAAAAKRLASISDPAAIGAIEAILCTRDETIARQAMVVIRNIDHERATQSLARQSVFSSSPVVRKSAAEALCERPMEEYVPLLLNSLYSTTEARVSIFRGPGNRLMHQHVLVREGQSAHEVAVLGTSYKRQALVGGDARETSFRAKLNMFQETMGLHQQVMLQNLSTTMLNNRITDSLSIATNNQLGTQPTVWWQWWNDHNEVYIEGTKGLAMSRSFREIKIQDQPPPQSEEGEQSISGLSGSSSGSGGSSSGGTAPRGRTRVGGGRLVSSIGLPLDCLAAGTPVTTARGMIAIEQVLVGDLVLSQNPETGELTYKPVLKTTIRPEGQLVRVEIGENEHFETSGGHLFWVAGEGWVKARALKSGMLLHTPDGAVHVSDVRSGIEAKTYNLIVADYHSYFAGRLRVLSHDNTVRRPTDASVPGLNRE